MRRDQLEHAGRAACQIIDRGEVIVVGSQAILGSYAEDALPVEAIMSVEIDILPLAASHAETTLLADLIEGVAGEFSSFEELDGVSIDGLDLETAILPAGSRDFPPSGRRTAFSSGPCSTPSSSTATSSRSA